MGHTRLGVIPKTRPWSAVVATFTGGSSGGLGDEVEGTSDVEHRQPMLSGADIAAVADQTLQVARGGLERSKHDAGLLYTVYLLTQVVLASREKDWQQRLVALGLHIGPHATLLDLTTEFQGAVDDWLATGRHHSDISEMAQRAAGQSLASLAASRAQTLFGDSGEELRLAVRSLSTKSGFADLGQAFFGRFISGFLNFYLSRVTAAHLGEGRLHQVGDITAFNESLVAHCQESAHIVRDFAGQWYSKTEYQRGIDLENTSGFVAVALSKLQDELRFQREASTSGGVGGDQTLERPA